MSHLVVERVQSKNLQCSVTLKIQYSLTKDGSNSAAELPAVSSHCLICKKGKSNEKFVHYKTRAYQKPGRVGFSLLSLLGNLPTRDVLLVILR